MAGGKLYIVPNLEELTEGMETINRSLEAVPAKLDEQIEQLKLVVSSTASGVQFNISAETDPEKEGVIIKTITNEDVLTNAGYTRDIGTFTSYSYGSVNLHFVSYCPTSSADYQTVSIIKNGSDPLKIWGNTAAGNNTINYTINVVPGDVIKIRYYNRIANGKILAGCSWMYSIANINSKGSEVDPLS